jgi:hypothetical protein
VAGFAQGAESFCRAVEPFNEAVPRGESFGSDDRDDVVSVHLVLRESSSALRAQVELALSSSARIDAVTHVGLLDALIFFWPSGPSESAFDERDETSTTPFASTVGAFDINAALGLLGGFLFCGHRRLYKAFGSVSGSMCPEASCDASSGLRETIERAFSRVKCTVIVRSIKTVNPPAERSA